MTALVVLRVYLLLPFIVCAIFDYSTAMANGYPSKIQGLRYFAEYSKNASLNIYGCSLCNILKFSNICIWGEEFKPIENFHKYFNRIFTRSFQVFRFWFAAELRRGKRRKWEGLCWNQKIILHHEGDQLLLIYKLSWRNRGKGDRAQIS